MVEPITASFRDPSGFVFKKDGRIYRQVNTGYAKVYDMLMESGLYSALVEQKLLVPHREVDRIPLQIDAFKVLLPEQIPFISYPYEWCFSQLKDAALLTLQVQKLALSFGMTLKDASAYNVQFLRGKPVLIDTLSFEQFQGKPWVAYRQFCQHFLAPLALMAKVDLRLGTLSQIHLDGIPLDLAARLLPTSTKFSVGLLIHLQLHASSQAKHSDSTRAISHNRTLTKQQLLAIVESLESTVRSLKPPKQKTEWGGYYENTNYTTSAETHKRHLIEHWIAQAKPQRVWDVGANDGTFAEIASQKNIRTIATDIDPIAIERAYQRVKSRGEENLLPLIVDITNPSHAIGWANQERDSFLSRGTFDVTLCLALIHHLAIGNNVPFGYLARLFAAQTKQLIIEFVPKDDTNAQRLLRSRPDIFPHYTKHDFELEFSKYFQIVDQKAIHDSRRILYFMKAKQ